MGGQVLAASKHTKTVKSLPPLRCAVSTERFRPKGAIGQRQPAGSQSLGIFTHMNRPLTAAGKVHSSDPIDSVSSSPWTRFNTAVAAVFFASFAFSHDAAIERLNGSDVVRIKLGKRVDLLCRDVHRGL